MKKIIALCGCLWALCAGATNITNYPVRVNFNSNYWFLLSDVAAQTNWNLPGNYVASTADLNSLSNTLYQIVTNLSAGTATNVLLLDQASTKIEDLQDRVFPSDTDRLPLATDNDGSTPYTNYYTSIVEIRKKLSIITNFTLQVFTNAYFYETNFINVEFTTNLTVIDGLTNLSLTPNTVLKADANKRITSIANGTGALTNNNAGLFGWYTYASLADITNTVISLLTTNRQIYYTNACAAPDFSKDYGWTNVSASFTAPLPINVPAGDQAPTFAWHVENSGGSPIQVSVNPSIDIVPGSAMWVTGRTTFTFHIYGRQFTNVYGVPNK